MSSKYELLNRWYNLGLWSLFRMKWAVKKGWITPEEYKDITSLSYDEDEENGES